jgi:hypothetical protein
MHTFVLAVTILFSVLVTAPRAQAQTTHTASPAALDAAVQEQVVATETDRAAVERLLNREDVKAVAAGAGIDIRSLNTAVAGMGSADLAGIANQARSVEGALAGGQSTITISTTVIIIALLILILIVVA